MFLNYEFRFKISTYHPTILEIDICNMDPDVKVTHPENCQILDGSAFWGFGKMPYLRYTPIWSKLGGWRYTKQYIIRRDFHGRLHPKLTLLHAEICRFLTPPKWCFSHFGHFRRFCQIVQICTFCTFVYFAYCVMTCVEMSC